MKKLIAILAIAMLISGTCYADSATAPDLSANLVATTTLEIEVLDAFFLVVSPDVMELDVDAETGSVESTWINVLAGCGDAGQDWHLRFTCSNFVNKANSSQTFSPDVLSMQFAPGMDATGDNEIGDVLNDYDDGKAMPAYAGEPPVPQYVNVYSPLTANRQGTHGCAAALYGNMPSASTGTYEAILTFEMVAGLPA